MHYKITITEVSETTTTRKGQWCVIEKRPWTVDEANDSPPGLVLNAPIKEVMGYAPDVTTTQETTKEVFTQTVEHREFDLKKVIAAINNLPTVGAS